MIHPFLQPVDVLLPGGRLSADLGPPVGSKRPSLPSENDHQFASAAKKRKSLDDPAAGKPPLPLPNGSSVCADASPEKKPVQGKSRPRLTSLPLSRLSVHPPEKKLLGKGDTPSNFVPRSLDNSPEKRKTAAPDRVHSPVEKSVQSNAGPALPSVDGKRPVLISIRGKSEGVFTEEGESQDVVKTPAHSSETDVKSVERQAKVFGKADNILEGHRDGPAKGRDVPGKRRDSSTKTADDHETHGDVSAKRLDGCRQREGVAKEHNDARVKHESVSGKLEDINAKSKDDRERSKDAENLLTPKHSKDLSSTPSKKQTDEKEAPKRFPIKLKSKPIPESKPPSKARSETVRPEPEHSQRDRDQDREEERLRNRNRDQDLDRKREKDVNRKPYRNRDSERSQDRDRDGDGDRDRGRKRRRRSDSQSERGVDHERIRDKDRDRGRRDHDRDRVQEREADRDRERERDRDRYRERDHGRGRGGDRGRDGYRDPERSYDRERDGDREQDRDWHDRDRERSRNIREQDRERERGRTKTGSDRGRDEQGSSRRSRSETDGESGRGAHRKERGKCRDGDDEDGTDIERGRKTVTPSSVPSSGQGSCGSRGSQREGENGGVQGSSEVASETRLQGGKVDLASVRTKLKDFENVWEEINTKCDEHLEKKEHGAYEEAVRRAFRLYFDWGMAKETELRMLERLMPLAERLAKKRDIINHYRYLTRTFANKHLKDLEILKRKKTVAYITRGVNKAYLRVFGLHRMWQRGQRTYEGEARKIISEIANARSEGRPGKEDLEEVATKNVLALRGMADDYCNIVQLFESVVSDDGEGPEEAGNECKMQ